jgi:hypothetical protein
VSNPIPAAIASRSRLPYLILLAAIAVIAFALGSEAASAGTGGLGPDRPAKSSKAEDDGDKYDRIWENDVSGAEKRWARQTAECESGGDPKAIGGGGTYRGAFQFMKSTWRTSPKSPGGDPIDYDYRTQAVVAVMLKREMGSSPWPNCG